MGKAGTVLLPGNLDPRAEEYRPVNPCGPGPAWTPQFLPRICYPLLLSNDAHAQPVCPPPQPYYITSGEAVPLLPATLLPPPASVPTRALLLANVPADASESLVRWELEVFGEVRAVQMERVREGIVAVHFYDLRDASQAMTAIQLQHQARLPPPTTYHRCDASALLSHNSACCWVEESQQALSSARGLIGGRAVWAQFMVPATSAYPDGRNQGSLVLFDLPPSVTARRLRDIFEAFGGVREIRGTPLNKAQRFVEFFDVRDARRAFQEMNGKLINGRNVVIDFSRPGGFHYHATPKTIASSAAASFGASTVSPMLSRKLSGRSSADAAAAARKSSQVVDGRGSVLASQVAGLSLNGVGVAVADDGLRVHGEARKKNAKKSCHHHRPASAEYSSSHAPSPKSRMSRSKRRGNADARFMIKDEATADVGGGDSRTTLMIKNIPNKYSQILLLNMLDNHCVYCNEHIADDEPPSAFDFLYLPIDFNNKCNVGYGFVNLTTPQAARKLYNALHLKPWAVFNSKKICEITYARLQGLEALKEHFKSSRFGCVAENYLPVVFSPPRDGRELTEPLAIACRVACPTPPSSSSFNTGSIAGLVSYGGTDDQEEMDGLQHVSSDDVEGLDEGDVGCEYGGCRNGGNGGGGGSGSSSNLCTVVSVA